MSVIARATLLEFLSDYAAPDAEFPTGARMQAAGSAHRNADAHDCGFDYSFDEVAHAIGEWISFRDARAYVVGYNSEPIEKGAYNSQVWLRA